MDPESPIGERKKQMVDMLANALARKGTELETGAAETHR